ncbi:uncharacterized protein LOC119652195 [Hermetia illucens]|uniref:uncharacterized protein LOC119652195 n=1 Tax=Hermetia illucens TaxID=343691 RepID=UPI0018CBF981|nr:uncharacterized protein LOC119652195 [Hermetia illucens]
MRYWILNDQKVIRSEIHRCLTCVKYVNIRTYIPAVRVIPNRPFLHCGVDYAGPFRTRMSKGWSNAILKGYVCVFVCMVTKAVHLELVSDLSTEAFLAAFKRFTASLYFKIYSDHGTNFVEASNHLDKEMQQAIDVVSKKVAAISAKDGIIWKFLPVATPHFGGLCEVAVKSAKQYLKCVLDEAKIISAFEEFPTVLCQAEACLNSRPLVPISNNPDDLEALTPSHFLVQRALAAVVEVDRTQRSLYEWWQQLKAIHQTFWQRWTREYPCRLRTRTKWIDVAPNVMTGQLVLLLERDTLLTK